jgi:hypothetical protein
MPVRFNVEPQFITINIEHNTAPPNMALQLPLSLVVRRHGTAIVTRSPRVRAIR